MESSPSPPTPPPAPLSPPPVPVGGARPCASSLATRLMNVFVAPGEVFDEIKAGCSSFANWLVPALLMVVVGLISTQVIFSQDAVVHQIREEQERRMEKQLAKMPKEQREQVMKATEKYMGPAVMKIGGSVGAVVGSFLWIFGLALLIWLLGRFALKAPFPFLQGVEVSGLASMISVLGGLISMLLIVITGNLRASLGPGLLLRDFDAASKTHLLLAGLNVMTLWYLAVLAIGLGRLSGAGTGKALLWLLLPWMAFKGAMIGLGWG